MPDNGVEGHVSVTLRTVAAEDAAAQDLAVVQFSSPTAVVLENAGKVEIELVRFGKLDNSFKVQVETLDRTAKGDVDYKAVKEVLTFEEGEVSKKLSIDIVDDKNWNPDKVFLVRLSLLDENEDIETKEKPQVAKGRICVMTVTIVDDDEPGLISFGQRLVTVGEGSGKVLIPVLREQGADGEIKIKYKTIDGTARSGRDFKGGEGELILGHGVTRKDIEVAIVNDYEEEKDEYFEVVLQSATNGAKLGKIRRTMVTITNDDDYNTAMGKLIDQIKINRDGLLLHREVSH